MILSLWPLGLFFILLALSLGFREKAFKRFVVDLIIATSLLITVGLKSSLLDGIVIFAIMLFFSFVFYRSATNIGEGLSIKGRNFKFRLATAVLAVGLFLFAVLKHPHDMSPTGLNLLSFDFLNVFASLIALFLLLKRPSKWNY